MAWCSKEEPQVIDDEMIQEIIRDMARKGEAGRLQNEEGIPLEEIKEIRFEMKKILRIDHLWVLPYITKLNLNNNLIEKIENLDTLIHLKELNLSFNKIAKIESLEKLNKLEILNLFENRIQKIENLESQKYSLIIFSIGRNSIEDKTAILHFRRFKYLKSLNMAGNPCVERDEDFRIYVATFLPQLVYYEYKMILSQEREQGFEKFGTTLLSLEDREQEENIKIAKREQDEADAEKHSVSYVEYLGGSFLFDSMFENDVEGKLFLLLGGDLNDYYNEFKENFVTACVRLFEFGQEQYALRMHEINDYEDTVEEATKEEKRRGIQMIEDFLENKNDILDEVRQLTEMVMDKELDRLEYYIRIGEISESFNQKLHEIWKRSMKFQVTLFGQMEDVNQLFELSLTDLMNTFIEGAQAVFSELRTFQSSYNDNVNEIAMQIFLSKDKDQEFDIPEQLKQYFTDKDTLSNALGASHDMHLQVIDNREDTLISRARAWLKNIVDNLEMNEISINRTKIFEVNNFIDIQREEFELLLFEDESSDDLVEKFLLATNPNENTNQD